MNLSHSLAELTVVIPTFSRRKYLERTVAFVTQFPFARIIVVDGTPGIDAKDFFASKFPSVDYQHSEVGFVGRVVSTFDRVETKYVALWGDDEFWLPSFQANAIEFLNHNEDYSLCIGLAVRFNTSRALTLHDCYPGLRDLEALAGSSRERLLRRFELYPWGGLWGVCRTDAWKNAWLLAKELEIGVRGSTEILFEAAMAWQGKTRVMNEIAWLRSMENPSITSGGDASLGHQSPNFHNWWPKAEPEKRREFLTGISRELNLSGHDATFFGHVFDVYSKMVGTGEPRHGLASRLAKLAHNLPKRIVVLGASLLNQTNNHRQADASLFRQIRNLGLPKLSAQSSQELALAFRDC